MDVNKFCNYMLSHMSNAHFASGKRQINCRCPDCGDSINQQSAHMYIRVPRPEELKPSLYYCHKCGYRGLLTYKNFIDWGIYDQEIVAELEAYHKLVAGSKGNRKYFNSGTIYNVFQSYTNPDAKSFEKLAYINNRLGTNLNFNDIHRLKIVINLRDLLRENNITNLTRQPSIINDLDREFIGFLSVDNAFINMRRTCEEGIVYKSIDKRYINYTLFDKFDNSNKFYTIPSMVDLSMPGNVKLHIAEGPFDILSVYFNCRHMEPGIYSSVTGNNYATTIMYFMRDLAIPNLELHFYPDNDKFGTDKNLRRIMSLVPDRHNPVYVHRNISPGEKDFGVTPDRIIEQVNELKYYRG